jgi:hypothetical protein
MANKNLSRRTVLDPAVADLLSGMESKQAEARLPRKEREKKARERAKIRARKDARVTYDLPPALKQAIFNLAESLSLPASQLATLALKRFMSDYQAGEIDISKYKKPSRSPRYDWKLEFPPEWFQNL